jgi:hypothetical protein
MLFSTEKVELSKIDDLLNYAKGGDTDPFEELADLVQFANKLENKLYKKMQDVEAKQKESDKLRQMAKELGADRLLNTLDSADKLLSLKFKNIRSVIKLIQRAQQDNI